MRKHTQIQEPSFIKAFLVSSTLVLSAYMFFHVFQFAANIVVDKYIEEQEWRSERLHKYYGKQIEQFERNMRQ